MMATTAAKRLLIQGATGSIGQSTLDVVRTHAAQFKVVGLAARGRVEGLLSAAREFRPESLALEDTAHAETVLEFARNAGHLKTYLGEGAALKQAAEAEYDLLVNAQLGSAGLEPTMAALERGISVALANKETLVAAGPVVMKAAASHGAQVIPIDSEHSAIFQCLIGEVPESIRKIWLTTSGGPFWGTPPDRLSSVTVDQALAHPTWRMGSKITVDSATLFNKGLEVIETHRLFGVAPEQIGVVVHRQSVIHSMIEFIDGSIKAQMSRPDMRLPILYALTFPKRIESTLIQTEVPSLAPLTFAPVEPGTFPCLDLAFDALHKGGTAPAAVSAADEVAVHAFLDNRIRFTDIATVLRDVLQDWPHEPLSEIAHVRGADTRARRLAEEAVSRCDMTRKVVACC